MGLLQKFGINKKKQTFPDEKDVERVVEVNSPDDGEGVTSEVEEVTKEEEALSVDYTDGGTREEEFLSLIHI